MKILLYKLSVRFLVVKPAYMCKRGKVRAFPHGDSLGYIYPVYMSKKQVTF